MQLHEAIGQRQAEPGALELAAETAVDLLEGREGTRDVLGGDADAGVAHLANEAAVAGAARGQRNPAAFRPEPDRAEERRCGQGGGRTGQSRWATHHKKNK